MSRNHNDECYLAFKQQWLPRLLKASKNAAVDAWGRVHIEKTLLKNNLPTNDAKLHSWLKEIFIHAGETSVTAGGRTPSMPLGKNALDLGWTKCKQPAVYEIVCGPTGRRYIGQSRRPDLRRAVHLFYLKNPRKFAQSNVFFGIPLLDDDVTAHGFDSFYMDIIQSFPEDVEDSVLFAAEVEAKQKAELKNLYNLEMNKFDHTATYRGCRFLHFEPDMKKLHFKLARIIADRDEVQEEYVTRRPQWRQTIESAEQAYQDNQMTGKERHRIRIYETQVRRGFKDRIKILMKQESECRKAITDLNRVLRKKWS